MALALAPLAEMAGSAMAPMVEDLVGKEAYQTLSPLAKQALSKVMHSKKTGRALHKIGNHFFGKKHKTARKLLRKGRSVAGVFAGKDAQKLIKGGLKVGSSLGMLSPDQADNIAEGYKKALSIHDKMSQFNKKHEGLTPKNVKADDIKNIMEDLKQLKADIM